MTGPDVLALAGVLLLVAGPFVAWRWPWPRRLGWLPHALAAAGGLLVGVALALVGGP